MDEPGLDDRHRNEDGRIREKNSNTRIDTVRETYPNYAPGYSGDGTLGNYLEREGYDSLSQSLKHPKQ